MHIKYGCLEQHKSFLYPNIIRADNGDDAGRPTFIGDISNTPNWKMRRAFICAVHVCITGTGKLQKNTNITEKSHYGASAIRRKITKKKNDVRVPASKEVENW